MTKFLCFLLFICLCESLFLCIKARDSTLFAAVELTQRKDNLHKGEANVCEVWTMKRAAFENNTVSFASQERDL